MACGLSAGVFIIYAGCTGYNEYTGSPYHAVLVMHGNPLFNSSTYSANDMLDGGISIRAKITGTL